MKFYSYTYKVKTDINDAFHYFLQKDYLMRYFSQKEVEDDEMELISEYPSNTVAEGEEIKILFKEDDDTMSIQLKATKIRKNELISYDMTFGGIEEHNSQEGEIDEEEFASFMEWIFGEKIKYEINFKQQADYLVINEVSSTFSKSIWAKILVKLSGLYFRIKQRKTHKQVKNDLNQLKHK